MADIIVTTGQPDVLVTVDTTGDVIALPVSGAQGPAGATGAAGAPGGAGAAGTNGVDGAPAGVKYAFDSNTTMANPGAGSFRINGGNTAIAISYTSAETGNPDVSTFLKTFDSSTTTLHRGFIFLYKKTTPQNFFIFEVTGATTDNSTWLQFAVTLNSSSGSFSGGDAVTVGFSRTGNISTGALLVANNLSDLNNVTTARSNLSLGSAATLNVGTAASNVVQLDGSAKLPAVDGSQLTNLPNASNVLWNYIAGLVLSNDGVSPNTKLDIAAGQASDSTNTSMLLLNSAWTKTTGAWVAGTGNGGLQTADGALASWSWYHVFVIFGSSPGVDILFSKNTAPTLPATYTLFRRIGSFKTDNSSNILTFVQHSKEFWWKVAGSAVKTVAFGGASNTDFETTTLSTSITNVPLQGSPPGVIVQAITHAATWTSGIIYIHDAALTDQQGNWILTGQVGVPPAVGGTLKDPTASGGMFQELRTWTDTSQQIKARGSLGSQNLGIVVVGWYDLLGT